MYCLDSVSCIEFRRGDSSVDGDGTLPVDGAVMELPWKLDVTKAVAAVEIEGSTMVGAVTVSLGAGLFDVRRILSAKGSLVVGSLMVNPRPTTRSSSVRRCDISNQQRFDKLASTLGDTVRG